MPNAFRSSGTTQGTEFAVEQLLNRTSRSKTSAVAKVIHKERHNYLDDVEFVYKSNIQPLSKWAYLIVNIVGILYPIFIYSIDKVLMDWVLRYGVGKAYQIILLHYIKWQA